MSRPIRNLSLSAMAQRIDAGTLFPSTIAEACLDRIEERDERVNAFITVNEGAMRSAAATANQAATGGTPRGPLHGIPIAIKDEVHVAGMPTTFGSVPFADDMPAENDLVVDRILDAGGIIAGKTNLPEFGCKGTTDNLLVGPTSNPFDLTRNAGGSSGGSAAAVADGMVPAAIGLDGGGSLRIPAAWCGVYALKPTFRRVPTRERPDAYSSHSPFLSVGPLTRTVEDAAIVLDVIAGHHPQDPLSIPSADVAYREAVDQSIDGLDIAYSEAFGGFPVDAGIRETTARVCPVFEQSGATVREIEVDFGYAPKRLTETWIDLVKANFYTAHEYLKDDRGMDLLADHRTDLTEDYVRLVEGGADLELLDYKQLGRVRTDVFEALCDVFERTDLLVTPMVGCPPVANATDGGTTGPTRIDGKTVEPSIGWCLTFPVNLTGHPAASIPCGFTDSGLPVGLQLIGPRFSEPTLLAASAAYERLSPWQDSYPSR